MKRSLKIFMATCVLGLSMATYNGAVADPPSPCALQQMTVGNVCPSVGPDPCANSDPNAGDWSVLGIFVGFLTFLF